MGKRKQSNAGSRRRNNTTGQQHNTAANGNIPLPPTSSVATCCARCAASCSRPARRSRRAASPWRSSASSPSLLASCSVRVKTASLASYSAANRGGMGGISWGISSEGGGRGGQGLGVAACAAARACRAGRGCWLAGRQAGRQAGRPLVHMCSWRRHRHGRMGVTCSATSLAPWELSSAWD
jgi:hypothetical protein